jgi:hypothetical protein
MNKKSDFEFTKKRSDFNILNIHIRDFNLIKITILKNLIYICFYYSIIYSLSK